MLIIIQLAMHIRQNKLALDPVWLTTSDALGLSCIPNSYDKNLLLERDSASVDLHSLNFADGANFTRYGRGLINEAKIPVQELVGQTGEVASFRRGLI